MPITQLLRRSFHLITLSVMLMVLTVSIRAQGYVETGYVSWHPGGTMIAVIFEDILTLYDAQTLDVLNTFSLREPSATDAVWSPDGTRLAIPKGGDMLSCKEKMRWHRPHLTVQVVDECLEHGFAAL